MKNILLIALFMTATFGVAIGAPSGSVLFERCQPCHGADGSRVPYGAERAIKGLSEKDVVTALEGYQAGTFGGAQKATMERMAAGLSKSDINALATYISKF